MALLLTASMATGSAALPVKLLSPDGRLAVEFTLDSTGAPRYAIHLDGQPALAESRLGVVRDDADFTQGLRLVSVSPITEARDRYEILTAKRRHNEYHGHRQSFTLATESGHHMEIRFQVSNDGVAFRYFFPGLAGDHRIRQIHEEATSFRFLPETRAWLQPMAVARTGWANTNPSYEEYYEQDIPVGTPSPSEAGWVYPALFRSGDVWLLVSEAAPSRRYCGTRLRHLSPEGEYTVGFPQPLEAFPGGPVNPESTLPWITTWRLIVVGNLATVVESTLGIDLADPPAHPLNRPVEPGYASWSWPLMGDGNTTFEVQRRFIDYAAEMGWKYTLIDALWDKQIGYEKIEELVEYARAKNVKILLWYNSAGDWNTSFQTPRNRMLERASRLEEFNRLQQTGVAGMKIDFFGGDGQSMIGYYLDILDDAAPYGFHINFHGSTLPRGLQRTYPYFMTSEAIRGLEFITFEQVNADRGPNHMAMIPFTRNVFDPMDFTPMVLDRINRIQRRSTSAFELALAVLFTSGIQHYAEIPEGMAKAPDYVRDYLRSLPAIWEEVKFLDGFPGRYAVVARQGGGRWFVSGINGENAPRELALDLTGLASGAVKGELIADGEGGNLSFRRESISLQAGEPLRLTVPAHGGFVIALEP
jgi:alpha-glucosidase